MKKRIIFTDKAIVDFCRATQDTNEVHDPAFMTGLNKRVIVPGMYAFCMTANLSAGFLKSGANYIRVCFNTLLSSGDLADLSAEQSPENPLEIRLSAINHKDTLTSRDEYTRIMKVDGEFVPQTTGLIRQLTVTKEQVDAFSSLISATDPGVADLLFAISYASQALLKSIREAGTGVEKEIDAVINGDSKISPFYHTLEIFLPPVFPGITKEGMLDYRIHIEREKANRAYVAHLQCEQDGEILFRSIYRLVGIADSVILRMAKEIHHFLK
jgi:hypothetical protein